MKTPQLFHDLLYIIENFLYFSAKKEESTNKPHRWCQCQIKCPICSSPVKRSSIYVDSYISQILKETPEYVDDVIIYDDGNWKSDFQQKKRVFILVVCDPNLSICR